MDQDTQSPNDKKPNDRSMDLPIGMNTDEGKAYERRVAGIGVVVVVVVAVAALMFGASALFRSDRPDTPEITPEIAKYQKKDSGFFDFELPENPFSPVKPKPYPSTYTPPDVPARDPLIPDAPPAPDIPPPAPAPAYAGYKRVGGKVTNFADRTDFVNGRLQKNQYARTEYYMTENGMNCFFHHNMGLTRTLELHQHVIVAYNPRAQDACGTSVIVDE